MEKSSVSIQELQILPAAEAVATDRPNTKTKLTKLFAFPEKSQAINTPLSSEANQMVFRNLYEQNKNSIKQSANKGTLSARDEFFAGVQAFRDYITAKRTPSNQNASPRSNSTIRSPSKVAIKLLEYPMSDDEEQIPAGAKKSSEKKKRKVDIEGLKEKIRNLNLQPIYHASALRATKAEGENNEALQKQHRDRLVAECENISPNDSERRDLGLLIMDNKGSMNQSIQKQSQHHLSQELQEECVMSPLSNDIGSIGTKEGEYGIKKSTPSKISLQQTRHDQISIEETTMNQFHADVHGIGTNNKNSVENSLHKLHLEESKNAPSFRMAKNLLGNKFEIKKDDDDENELNKVSDLGDKLKTGEFPKNQGETDSIAPKLRASPETSPTTNKITDIFTKLERKHRLSSLLQGYKILKRYHKKTLMSKMIKQEIGKSKKPEAAMKIGLVLKGIMLKKGLTSLISFKVATIKRSLSARNNDYDISERLAGAKGQNRPQIITSTPTSPTTSAISASRVLRSAVLMLNKKYLHQAFAHFINSLTRGNFIRQNTKTGSLLLYEIIKRQLHQHFAILCSQCYFANAQYKLNQATIEFNISKKKQWEDIQKKDECIKLLESDVKELAKYKQAYAEVAEKQLVKAIIILGTKKIAGYMKQLKRVIGIKDQSKAKTKMEVVSFDYVVADEINVGKERYIVVAENISLPTNKEVQDSDKEIELIENTNDEEEKRKKLAELPKDQPLINSPPTNPTAKKASPPKPSPLRKTASLNYKKYQSILDSLQFPQAQPPIPGSQTTSHNSAMPEEQATFSPTAARLKNIRSVITGICNNVEEMKKQKEQYDQKDIKEQNGQKDHKNQKEQKGQNESKEQKVQKQQKEQKSPLATKKIQRLQSESNLLTKAISNTKLLPNSPIHRQASQKKIDYKRFLSPPPNQKKAVNNRKAGNTGRSTSNSSLRRSNTSLHFWNPKDKKSNIKEIKKTSNSKNSRSRYSAKNVTTISSKEANSITAKEITSVSAKVEDVTKNIPIAEIQIPSLSPKASTKKITASKVSTKSIKEPSGVPPISMPTMLNETSGKVMGESKEKKRKGLKKDESEHSQEANPTIPMEQNQILAPTDNKIPSQKIADNSTFKASSPIKASEREEDKEKPMVLNEPIHKYLETREEVKKEATRIPHKDEEKQNTSQMRSPSPILKPPSSTAKSTKSFIPLKMESGSLPEDTKQQQKLKTRYSETNSIPSNIPGKDKKSREFSEKPATILSKKLKIFEAKTEEADSQPKNANAREDNNKNEIASIPENNTEEIKKSTPAIIEENEDKKQAKSPTNFPNNKLPSPLMSKNKSKENFKEESKRKNAKSGKKIDPGSSNAIENYNKSASFETGNNENTLAKTQAKSDIGLEMLPITESKNIGQEEDANNQIRAADNLEITSGNTINREEIKKDSQIIQEKEYKNDEVIIPNTEPQRESHGEISIEPHLNLHIGAIGARDESNDKISEKLESELHNEQPGQNHDLLLDERNDNLPNAPLDKTNKELRDNINSKQNDKSGDELNERPEETNKKDNYEKISIGQEKKLLEDPREKKQDKPYAEELDEERDEERDEEHNEGKNTQDVQPHDEPHDKVYEVLHNDPCDKHHDRLLDNPDDKLPVKLHDEKYNDLHDNLHDNLHDKSRDELQSDPHDIPRDEEHNKEHDEEHKEEHKKEHDEVHDEEHKEEHKKENDEDNDEEHDEVHKMEHKKEHKKEHDEDHDEEHKMEHKKETDEDHDEVHNEVNKELNDFLHGESHGESHDLPHDGLLDKQHDNPNDEPLAKSNDKQHDQPLDDLQSKLYDVPHGEVDDEEHKISHDKHYDNPSNEEHVEVSDKQLDEQYGEQHDQSLNELHNDPGDKEHDKSNDKPDDEPHKESHDEQSNKQHEEKRSETDNVLHDNPSNIQHEKPYNNPNDEPHDELHEEKHDRPISDIANEQKDDLGSDQQEVPDNKMFNEQELHEESKDKLTENNHKKLHDNLQAEPLHGQHNEQLKKSNSEKNNDSHVKPYSILHSDQNIGSHTEPLLKSEPESHFEPGNKSLIGSQLKPQHESKNDPQVKLELEPKINPQVISQPKTKVESQAKQEIRTKAKAQNEMLIEPQASINPVRTETNSDQNISDGEKESPQEISSCKEIKAEAQLRQQLQDKDTIQVIENEQEKDSKFESKPKEYLRDSLSATPEHIPSIEVKDTKNVEDNKEGENKPNGKEETSEKEYKGIDSDLIPENARNSGTVKLADLLMSALRNNFIILYNNSREEIREENVQQTEGLLPAENQQVPSSADSWAMRLASKPQVSQSSNEYQLEINNKNIKEEEIKDPNLLPNITEEAQSHNEATEEDIKYDLDKENEEEMAEQAKKYIENLEKTVTMNIEAQQKGNNLGSYSTPNEEKGFPKGEEDKEMRGISNEEVKQARKKSNEEVNKMTIVSIEEAKQKVEISKLEKAPGKPILSGMHRNSPKSALSDTHHIAYTPTINSVLEGSPEEAKIQQKNTIVMKETPENTIEINSSPFHPASGHPTSFNSSNAVPAAIELSTSLNQQHSPPIQDSSIQFSSNQNQKMTFDEPPIDVASQESFREKMPENNCTTSIILDICNQSVPGKPTANITANRGISLTNVNVTKGEEITNANSSQALAYSRENAEKINQLEAKMQETIKCKCVYKIILLRAYYIILIQ